MNDLSTDKNNNKTFYFNKFYLKWNIFINNISSACML